MSVSGRLNEIEARVEAATEGPWKVDLDGIPPWSWDGESEDEPHGWVSPHGAYTTSRADNEFIAAARSDIPWLVGRVRELEEALRRIAEDHLDHEPNGVQKIARAALAASPKEDTA